MLLSHDLIKDAVKHFPRWMDIRKRYKTSTGGKLLGSIAQEIEVVHEEVEKYVEQFFIPFYEDKCDIIPSFVYKANIGQVNIDELVLTSPSLEITENIKDFYESDNLAYYQDGFIFIKDNCSVIFYTVDSFTMEASTEKMHVWNAYDEFATFVGIERYQDEDNTELFNRIIATSRRVLNSSEDGLKNAITASLTNIIPEFNIEDIKLEKPTAENLVKYYDGFETALDKLMNINKDVLRVKSWDIDRWSNDFKQIDYIPHVWDILLDEYVNGIGDDDDLKTILIDANNKTDIELSFYTKSEEVIDKYIKNKDIDDTLNLSLIKYNNVLEPCTAKYKITASEAIDIQEVENEKEIMAVISEISQGENFRTISDIGIGFNNIKIEQSGHIDKDKYYRIKFLPKSKYDSMEIYECAIRDENGQLILNEDGEYLDFKRTKGNFILNGSTLVNKYVKKSVNKKSQFAITENISDTGTGVTIDKINELSKMILNIDGCNSEPLKILYDCEMSNVLDSNIILNNFFYDKNTKTYLSDEAGDEKSIIINIKANQFKTIVNRGQCNITAIINGQPAYSGAPILNNGKFEFSTKRYNVPQNMQIIITALGTNQVEVEKMLYTSYDIILSTTEGELAINSGEDDLYTLPVMYENNLIITLRTRTQFAPILRKIFIGRSLDNTDAYESDIFKGIDYGKICIRSNCDVELYESNAPFAACNKYDQNQKVTVGYSTDDMYVATDNDAYILLDTSAYININSVKVDEGTYEAVGTGKSQSHIIRLKKNQGISGVTIDGHYNTVIDIKTIHELIANKCTGYLPSVRNENGLWIEGDRLYVSKLLKCFIVERITGEQIKVDLDIESFNISSDAKISKIEIVNLPDCLEAAFISTNGLIDDKSVSIGTSYNGSFESFYIYPKNSKEYVAKNEYITYTAHKTDIEIVNTFNNGYIDNMFMAYKIEPIMNDLDVVFSNSLNWTVGKKTISLNLNKEESFNVTNKVITETIKLGSTINLKEIYTAENKEVIELAQYIIDDQDKDYKVIYKNEYNNPSYEKAEFIDVKNDGFNKLRYSNIVEIKYLGTEVYDEDEYLEEIDPEYYELDKEKGIIKWKNEQLINSSPRLYIIYTIKKAIAIKYDIDSLYNKIQYPVSAYKKLSSFNLKELEGGQKINLTDPIIGDIDLSQKISKAYSESDIVYVHCKEPGFEAEKIEDNLLITKVAESNTLAVKSGWYYMFGREYYLYATDQSENIVEDEYVSFQEISKTDNELFMHKKTSNNIRNSKMILGSLATSYNINNFNELKELRGSSDINSITACDSYNNWHTFGMNMSLVNGLNGMGLFFEPYEKKDIAYALLDITNYIKDKTHISFYNPDKLKVYIGKETAVNNILLTDTINISTLTEIISTDINNIQYATFTKDENCKYYLVVRGEGLIDDIIVQSNDNPNFNLHTKNVTTLNLELNESIASGVVSRLFIDNSKGNKNNGTEINSEGYIVNASNIDWNITKIKSFTDRKDWLSGCELDNVNIVNINEFDCAAMTESKAGKIVTRPIYVGDPNTINSIIFKINNVPLKNMKGFNAQLYQSQTINGPFLPCKQKLNNNSSLNYTKDLIYPYIQLSVEMPQKKVIDIVEIYAEHKSTERFSPTEKIENNGQFISKVLDSRYTSTYKLKSIEIEDIQGPVELFIRASKENAETTVWTDWHQIEIEDGVISNDIVFEEFRFFQVKASLGSKESKIKLKHIEVEVIK